MDWYEVILS